MTIHHDKLAYGKLASRTEEMSEDEINSMLRVLNGEEEHSDKDEAEEGKPQKI